MSCVAKQKHGHMEGLQKAERSPERGWWARPVRGEDWAPKDEQRHARSGWWRLPAAAQPHVRDVTMDRSDPGWKCPIGTAGVSHTTCHRFPLWFSFPFSFFFHPREPVIKYLQAKEKIQSYWSKKVHFEEKSHIVSHYFEHDKMNA